MPQGLPGRALGLLERVDRLVTVAAAATVTLVAAANVTAAAAAFPLARAITAAVITTAVITTAVAPSTFTIANHGAHVPRTGDTLVDPGGARVCVHEYLCRRQLLHHDRCHSHHVPAHTAHLLAVRAVCLLGFVLRQSNHAGPCTTAFAFTTASAAPAFAAAITAATVAIVAAAVI